MSQITLPSSQLATYTASTKAPFLCRACERPFNSSQAIALHYKRAHEGMGNGGPKRPKGHKAKAIAARPAGAKGIAKYTDDKKPPFRCRECAASFPKGQGIAMHYRRTHLGFQPTPPAHPAPRASGLDSVALFGTNGTNGHTHTKLGRKTRTFWTVEEQQKLHEHIMANFHYHPEEGITLAVVVKAMHKALPEARWRKITTRIHCQEVFDRAEADARGIVTKGFAPPEVITTPVEVQVAYDLTTVLREAPLPRLAAILAEREMELKLRHYTMPPATPAAPRPVPLAEKLVASGADAEHVEALLPHIQVIGFRGHQHTAMLARFRGKPVIFLPSIDPSLTVDPARLGPKGTLFFYDSQSHAENWWSFIVDRIPPSQRTKFFGASRLLDNIGETFNLWAADHPAEFKLWQAAQVK